jgi:hypothetical protein
MGRLATFDNASNRPKVDNRVAKALVRNALFDVNSPSRPKRTVFGADGEGEGRASALMSPSSSTTNDEGMERMIKEEFEMEIKQEIAAGAGECSEPSDDEDESDEEIARLTAKQKVSELWLQPLIDILGPVEQRNITELGFPMSSLGISHVFLGPQRSKHAC